MKTAFEVQPSRSSDFGPLDLNLWGSLQSLRYSHPIENEELLHQRMLDACQIIRNRAGTFERVRQSTIKCIHASIDSGGGHFQHVLRILT